MKHQKIKTLIIADMYQINIFFEDLSDFRPWEEELLVKIFRLFIKLAKIKKNRDNDVKHYTGILNDLDFFQHRGKLARINRLGMYNKIIKKEDEKVDKIHCYIYKLLKQLDEDVVRVIIK